MQLFRMIFLLIWIAVACLTVLATRHAGIAASSDVFLQDIAALDWRSQFDADLLAHMLLLGTWVAWRRGFTLGGIATGFLCVMGGSLFTLLYVVGLSIYHKGAMREVLLGTNAVSASR